MTKPEQLAASVRQRLKNLTGTNDFQTMLVRYALERLLYRLSRSNYQQQFVLKGALLFDIWLERSHRATRDVDFLGFGDSTPARIEEIFRELCSIDVVADGLEFAVSSVVSCRIKADCEYEGVRINLLAYLSGTRTQIPVQVDVGFGDAITPRPVSVEFPALLSFPAPQVLSYPRETVVAEKFQAMVLLGMSNTRLKDFYDLWVLATYFSFDGIALGSALTATFERRRTPLPQTHAEVVALTPLFTTDAQKQQAWKAFLRKHQLVANELSLMEVVEIIQEFVLPVSVMVSKGELFVGQWDCDRREWKM
ncbi:nucleotidyl transferase AbiEii/AbiGii toxin family protein [Chamaesiphon polymorphus]|uniref:Nucleotidyl transferase AbiEii/AbiGii toxin family protein n=1 Tax=Chamaesiphon polymorphus CCALA 037 TaxID=2107692 RepID=A0A2T1GJ13_9CYAN|nr:nucleotidyl transferase AbiEii/AbiGii toxin family protein [Chamaesiphon polymorphus]PSB57641.1 nucleotidyl transferase AbiEii/AbiGii toxin family protein [Chamaesiphon polymorphus CCALA 037]